jgi:uncharacterized protein YlxW (UPF0749 family)
MSYEDQLGALASQIRALRDHVDQQNNLLAAQIKAIEDSLSNYMNMGLTRQNDQGNDIRVLQSAVQALEVQVRGMISTLQHRSRYDAGDSSKDTSD